MRTTRPESPRGGVAGSPKAAVLEASAAAARRRGGCWRLRDWRLRTKLTAVLLIPLILAGVLGGLRITDLVLRAQNSAALAHQISYAQQLGVLAHALQAERYLVVTIQAGDRGADPAALRKQRQLVDSAVAAFRAGSADASSFPAASGDRWAFAYQSILNRLSGLAALRRAASVPGEGGGEANSRTALVAYTELIAALLDLDRQALSGAPDVIASHAEAIKALTVAEEEASGQHAIVQIGILTDGLSTDQQLMLRTAQARFDAAAAEFTQVSTPAQRQTYFQAEAVTNRKRLLDVALDRTVRGAPLEVVPGSWSLSASATVELMWQGQTTLLGELRGDASQRGDRALHQALWDGSIIGILLLLAVALLIVVVRSLLRPLRALRTAAFEVADRRLPEAVGQLRSVDGTPGQARVDPVPVHSKEEVGQVARAVDTVHVQAVRLAAEQAQLRSSLNDISLRLAGRHQSLLEQQLYLLQRVREETGDLRLLSRLDQLTGMARRMRRHSDTLRVVAGGTVRRSVGAPVPVGEVFRAAVAEIEDGARVVVRPTPALTVHAAAVTDLVHLLAELLDNATSAAPQGTDAILSGSLTEDSGLLVEITDSGEGIPAEVLATINERLASAPSLDPADPPDAGQIGLFVVRELAAQYGIAVRLGQRDAEAGSGGGVTATVRLPPELIGIEIHAEAPAPEPALETLIPVAAIPEPSGQGLAGDLVPGQVLVVEAADSAGLFSPASLSPAWLDDGTSRSERPRSAHEEWLELFGSDSQPEFLAETVPAAEPLTGIPQTNGSSEVREEIYEMVSAWFREQRSRSLDDPPPVTEPAWGSPLDEGWRVAEALRNPIDHGLTESGLPKRRPREHLVSGVDNQLFEASVPAAVFRTPDDVRRRLSRYQSGLRVGRHARREPDEWRSGN